MTASNKPPIVLVHGARHGGGCWRRVTKLRTDPGWRFHELKTGHDCMVTEPAETARLILSVA